jgi:hypothetical protein
MTEKWTFPTHEEIIQNNIKVNELVVRANQFTNTVDDYQSIFNEAMLVNPNHITESYANQLNQLKYNLYERIHFLENQNV